MKGNENLFSFCVFAVTAFFCTGAYYLHTGLLGALLAMLGIGICAAALFHRALQRHFITQEEIASVRDEAEQQRLQQLFEQMQQEREMLLRGNQELADALHSVREKLDSIAESGMETRGHLQEIANERRELRTETQKGTKELNNLGADVLPRLFSALEARMTEMRQDVAEKLEAFTEQQQITVQKLGELTEKAQDIVEVGDINSRKAEAGNQHLAQMVQTQTEQLARLEKLDHLRLLRKIYDETKRTGDAAEDLQRPLEEMTAPLSDTLTRVMKDIEHQNKAQQVAMEQYKSMTEKDMKLLEQLAKAVK